MKNVQIQPTDTSQNVASDHKIYQGVATHLVQGSHLEKLTFSRRLTLRTPVGPGVALEIGTSQDVASDLEKPRFSGPLI